MYKVEFSKNDMAVILNALSELDAVRGSFENSAIEAIEMIGDDDRNYNALNAAIGSLMEIIDLNL